MTSRRSLIPAVLAAAAALAPAAAAQSPPPTLTWDRACYTEDQPMTFTGAGYTPGGPVDLVFSRVGTVLGSYEATADAAWSSPSLCLSPLGRVWATGPIQSVGAAT